MVDKPISSSLLKTLEENNYKNKKTTLISIDSKNKINKNEYTINLNKTFNNVLSIKLKQIQFPNSIAPVTKYNNKIRFILPGIDEYKKNNCMDIKNPEDNLLAFNKEYLVEIPVGYYTVKGLEVKIQEVMSNILLEEEITTIDIRKQNLLSFKVNIDPINYKTTFINILEEFDASLIQTILNPNTFSIDKLDNKIVQQFRIGGTGSNAKFKARDNCIYIYISGDKSNIKIIELFDENKLPLILGNIPSIGGIDSKFINKEYYNIKYKPLNYLGATYNTLLFDINNILNLGIINYFNNSGSSNIIKRNLFIIEFEIKNSNNNFIKSKYNQTIINEKFINHSKYDSSSINSCNVNLQQLIGHFNIKHIKNPFVGRGFFFNFILDKDKNKNNTNNSLLLNLGWSTDCNRVLVSDKCKYRAIHSNLDFQVKSKINFYLSNTNFIKPIFPDNFFLFQKIKNSDINILLSEEYIYMKIELLDGSIVNNKLQNLFCKILLHNNLNLLVNNNFTQNITRFDKSYLLNLSKLKISFIDKNGNLLESIKNHNFILEVTEELSILKNTNYNSKLNIINY